jgi:hypothetical protein
MGPPAGIFLFAETDLSLAVILWRHRFDTELRTHGEVPLAALVNFDWERIYFLHPYERASLNAEQKAKLFPTSSWTNFIWWDTNWNYWTIAYQRPGRPPFMIKIRAREWHLRKLTALWTTDRDAKLRLVPPDTIKATCNPVFTGQCLSLVDSRSRP